jgi:flagellar biosynthesis/type III secretory pathway M-ring protein FliF/YscJ
MGHSRKAVRQQAMARRQSHKRRRMILFVAVPVVIVVIVALVVLTKSPGYSGFDVIGKQPALVQVFLPG